MSYQTGDLIRVTGTFTVSGTATDPTTVTLAVRDPLGTVTSYTYGAAQLTKSATGVYYRDVSADTSGTWTYRFVGTGACQAALADTEFFVEPTLLG